MKLLIMKLGELEISSYMLPVVLNFVILVMDLTLINAKNVKPTFHFKMVNVLLLLTLFC